jgi:hypothetical protein
MDKNTLANKKHSQVHNKKMQTKLQPHMQEHTKSDTFALTQAHIDFLRQARVVWDPSEAGAPIIDPEVLSQSGLRRVPHALQVILKFGQIDPGSYKIANQLKDRYEMDEIRADSERNLLSIPKEDELTFELKPEHIKLLRNANADAFLYFGACGFNSRFPYGNMTYWEIDAAHTIGMVVYRDQNGVPNFSEDELTKLHGLHHDMLHALPVFLAHVKVEPGDFLRTNNIWSAAK